jgi:polyhydroxybutyrate depolymerase
VTLMLTRLLPKLSAAAMCVIVAAHSACGDAGAEPGPVPSASGSGGTGGSRVDAGTVGSAGTAGSAGVGGATAGSSGTTSDAASDAAGAAGTGGSGGADPTGGCGKPWTPTDIELEQRRGRAPMQVSRRSIAVGAAMREYLLAVPQGYDSSKPYPLVFGFHGSGGDREQLRRYMDVETPANGAAIFVYPGGLATSSGSTGWNLTSTSEDLVFVDALLEKYSAELCVDKKRIFATGHSFGGCMSNAMGCFRGGPLRAIAPIAGCTGGGRNAQCSGRIAALMIHSPNDTSTNYGGAIGACTRYLRANHCREMPACGCHWVDGLEDPADQCTQEAQQPYSTMVSITVDSRDDQPPVLRSYVECDPGYPVAFIDHWRREQEMVGSPNERWHNPPPWSGAVIWEFFNQLPVLDVE